jgi:hypothetical protein
MTRRTFLTGTLAAGTAALLSPRSRVLGANDDIRVAVIGFNGKGQTHIDMLRAIKGVRVVALCDADKNVIDRTVKRLEADKFPGKLETYQDIRKLLENKDIDAITTATPNHWHSLATVWACQAGKDVYVEKPISHEIWEGRKAVEAARKYNRIVQAGTQSRSCAALKEVFEYLQKGEMGKILYARGFCYKPRGSIGKVTGPTTPPPSVDYNLWCGPAPMEPLKRMRLHYDWHWVWPTGNGDIGNQGIHEMDMCRWALGQKGLAPQVISFGGRFVVDDDATTPNTLVTLLGYKPAPLIFEVRGLPRKKGDKEMDAYRKLVRIGVCVQCENGYFAGGAGGGWLYDKDDKQVKKFSDPTGPGLHMANFINAVRSRKPEDLHADILEGHLSSALCHMGNIPYRLGKEAAPDKIQETFKSHDQMLDSLERMKQHLAANDCDLAKSLAILGPSLEFDSDKEQFTGAMAAEANKYVTREYRAPFVVPEKV